MNVFWRGSGLTTVVDNWAKLAAGVDMMVGTQVMVGVPATEALRKPEPGEKGAPPNNAFLAYIHEHGDAAGRIPARPFLQPGVNDNRENIERGMRAVALAALNGNPAAVDRGLHRVGLSTQASVRRKITTGPFLPLAERTLAKRRARGRTGTKPLIDTAQLRNAINYVLRKVRSGLTTGRKGKKP